MTDRHPHLPRCHGSDQDHMVAEEDLFPVTVSPFEQYMAVQLGRRRDKTAKGPDAHGLKKSDDGWKLHASGALGELAVAKFLDLHWPARIGNYKGADIGDKIEVKTRMALNYDLLFRKNDKVTFYYVLALCNDQWLTPFAEKKVTKEEWTVFVVGWKHGEFCTEDRYEKEYGRRDKAWFVWQDELHTDFDRMLAHIYPERRANQAFREFVVSTGNRLAKMDNFLENGPTHPELKEWSD